VEQGLFSLSLSLCSHLIHLPEPFVLCLHPSHVRSDSSSQGWVGSAASHPTTFPHLYRLLLPFWAVRPSGPDNAAGADLEQDAAMGAVQEQLAAALGVIWTPGLSGPLVTLVEEVARIWGVQLAGRSSMQAPSPWPPLFLLDAGPAAGSWSVQGTC
jgi:hypothetical protein